MAGSNLSLLGRLSLAFGTFFGVLGDAQLAEGVLRLKQGAAPAPAAPPSPPPAPEPVTIREATPDAALQLLTLLQRDARLIDFVQEDITSYGDADIGAAARVVHAGCRSALREHFTIEPIRAEAEGARITLSQGFDASAVRLTGNVVGSPPFTGSLSHRGWRATDVRLPKLTPGHDASVIAPAEVTL
ncbi:MAG TPA: DUF2760 domain-containing protein [Paraburkholderia sp.]|jgi:hypothetical protein|nr:DUF2760 domain-containing protein [Paraburkholderia sp.]